MQAQAYDGYVEGGRFYPREAPLRLIGRFKAVLTVLDVPIQEKPDTWDELDKLVAVMPEKPRLEDFPRGQLGRELVNFEGV